MRWIIWPITVIMILLVVTLTWPYQLYLVWRDMNDLDRVFGVDPDSTGDNHE